MINKYFEKDDDLGIVRTKIHRLLNDDTIDDELSQLCLFLNTIMYLSLLNSTNQTVYVNEFIPGQEFLKLASDLTTETLNLHIQARLYDVLQVNKKDKFQNAQNAIEAYFQIAESVKSLTDKRDYLLRIIQVLKGLGKGNKTILSTIFDKIKQYILAVELFTECFSVTHVIEALTELEAESTLYLDFIPLLQNGREEQWNLAKFKCYRDCCNALARLIPNQSDYYGLAIATAYISEADELLKTPNISQHLVADKYQKALRIYKGQGIKDPRLGELELKLAEAQQKAVLQIYQVGNHKFQLTPNPELKFPDFDNIYQAIYWLISLPLPSKKMLEQKLKDRDRGICEQFFKKSTIADPKGNIVAASEDNADQLYADGKMIREIFCKTIITPMYDHFTDNVSISEMEVASVVWHSKFVPEDRWSIFVRGLFRGFCGNLVEAVQILVPQIENGLKVFLNDSGVITRKLDREVQTEKSLQYYLDELTGLLSEDLLFDLDGLLNQGFGDNLRHDLAHGLCPTTRMNSYLGLYTWWLSLKICLQI
jgi:tetratricopeptide (TPR) repeat protein